MTQDRIDLTEPFPTDAQLAAYFLGELPVAEAVAVAEWATEPDHAAQLVVWRRAWDAGQPVTVTGDLPQFLSGVRARIADVSPTDRPSHGTPIRRAVSVPHSFTARRTRFMRVLATSMFAAACGVALWMGVRSKTPAEQPARAYATASGQRATITLVDGSRIVLAPRSRVIVTDGTGAETRTVALEGEAYFVVASVERAPFVVRAGAVTTRVLGTVFSVRHTPSLGDVRVVVEQGKVSVARDVDADSAHARVLTAGMVANVGDSMHVTSVSDTRRYTAWRDGELLFDDARVSELLAAVGEWYGLELRLSDTVLAHERISTTLRVSSKAETFRALEQLLDVTLSPNGSVVTLRPRRTGARVTPTPRHDPIRFAQPKEIGK